MRIVVLHGPEAYLRQQYTNQLIEALQEAHGEVGEFRFDGLRTDPANLFDELRSYGLLQKYKLVILDDADLFITPPGSDEDENGDEGADASGGGTPRRKLLERYAESPVDHATLLLRARTWRKGNLDKLVNKVGTLVKCAEVSAQQAVSWAGKRCEKEYGCTIDRAAAKRLVDLIRVEWILFLLLGLLSLEWFVRKRQGVY